MKYTEYKVKNGVIAQISTFSQKNKAEENYAIFHIKNLDDNFEIQLQKINEAFAEILERAKNNAVRPVMLRYFLSDISNQIEFVQKQKPAKCAVSIVGQPPLDGSKIALWAWFSGEGENYTHLRIAEKFSAQNGSLLQTNELLKTYDSFLQKNNCTLAQNCIRTWFFVRDIDTNYGGVVKARKDFFTQKNLTEKTHYIASTGIGANTAQPQNVVLFDAYAVRGLQPEQIKFLYAPTHLSPTHKYGVTFERGVAVEYGDRKQIFISGTASIDKEGNVLHKNNIEAQTRRMWENVETLLAEAGAAFADVAQFIVYLRDIADYKTVSKMFKARFPETPTVITLAPVCRPAWLVEMECMATVKSKKSTFKDL